MKCFHTNKMRRWIARTSFHFTLKNLIAFVVELGVWSFFIDPSHAGNQSAKSGNFEVIKRRATEDASKRQQGLIIEHDNFIFPRVVTGSDAEDGEFPFMVSVQSHDTRYPWCGGTLLTLMMVLSAGHCFGSKPRGSDFDVLAGTVDAYGFYGVSKHSQRRRVLKILRHPNYTVVPLYSDLAILKTQGAFRVDMPYVNVHPLAHFPNLSWLYDQAENHPLCVGLGWGSVHPSRVPYAIILQKVGLELEPRSTCLAKLNDYKFLPDVQFCALGGITKDTCYGDSGSPLVCEIVKGMDPIVVGVVSWGIGCARRDIPAVYARVDYAETWIRSVIDRDKQPPSGYLLGSRTKLLVSVTLIFSIHL